MAEFNVNRYVDIVIKAFTGVVQREGYKYINNSKKNNFLGYKAKQVVEKAYSESANLDEFNTKIGKIKEEMEIAATKFIARYQNREVSQLKACWVKNLFNSICEDEDKGGFEFLCSN